MPPTTHRFPLTHTPLRLKGTAWYIGQLLTTCILMLGGGAKGVTYIQVHNIPHRLYSTDNSSEWNVHKSGEDEAAMGDSLEEGSS